MKFTRRKPNTVVNVIQLPLRLTPGDVLVIQSERRIPRDVFLKVRDQIQREFPDNKVLLLEAGLKIDVIEKDAA